MMGCSRNEKMRALQAASIVGIIAVALLVGLIAVDVFPSGNKGIETTTTLTQSLSSQTSQGVTLHTTLRYDFSLSGPIPLLTLTQNETFLLTENATTLSSPASLAFNLSQSYVDVYTNGTQWVSFSQPCRSSSTSSSGGIHNSASVSTMISLPCGQPPNSGWAPVNGSAASRHVALTSNVVQVSLRPSTFVANQEGALQLNITLNLKPGVYIVGLSLGVNTGSNFEISALAPFPIIVKSH